LQKNLRRAAEARGHTIWARSPDNAGHYNSEPNNTGFFCDGGDYDSYYGRFFLNWYSQVLLDHADRVLMLARLAFEGSAIAVKVSYRSLAHKVYVMYPFPVFWRLYLGAFVPVLGC
jgi:beta-amylase